MKKKIDLNKLNFNELKKEVQTLEKQKEIVTTKKIGVWQVGKNYVVRTVTMIDVGKLVAVTDQELVFENACWVADYGRWNNFLIHGDYIEAEPFPDGRVIVGRGSVIDAVVWDHDLIKEVR